MAAMATTKTLIMDMESEAAPLAPSSGPVEELSVGSAPVDVVGAADNDEPVGNAVGLAPVEDDEVDEADEAARVDEDEPVAAEPVDDDTAGTFGKV